MNKLLKPKDVAKRLNINRGQAYVLIRDGLIPNLRFGRCVRIRPEDLEEFIESNISGISSDLIKAKLALAGENGKPSGKPPFHRRLTLSNSSTNPNEIQQSNNSPKENYS